MNEPLRPARVDFSDASAPRAPDYDDVYHPRGGAFEQARHVFLAGNGLPQRWAQRKHFVILEAGFGLGHNFLATWAAWRDDPQRCEHLWFLSVDKHPLLGADLRRAHAHSAEPALARELVNAWPPLTPDLHRRDFAHGRIHLLLAFGELATWLPQWVAEVDAFYLDGFAPAKNPAMWEPRVLQRLSRLAAVGATAATWSSARVVRDALAAADFDVQRSAGFDAKRDMLRARHAPAHRAPQPPGRRFGARAREVAIVGAGLAGAAAARALAELGVPCKVFDALHAVAQGGSGQPAGLLHGVLHAVDSPHTRWFRAAALRAHAIIAPLIAQHRVPGRLDGLLRVEHALDHASMLGLLRAQGLPPDYVQALSIDEASERAGCALAQPAWLYAGGGWVEPLGLVRSWLDHALIDVSLNAAVDRIERDAQGRWRLLDSNGSHRGRQAINWCWPTRAASHGWLPSTVAAAAQPRPGDLAAGPRRLAPRAADCRRRLRDPAAAGPIAVRCDQRPRRPDARAARGRPPAQPGRTATPERPTVAARRRHARRPRRHGGCTRAIVCRCWVACRCRPGERARCAAPGAAALHRTPPGLHVLAGLGSRGLAQAALAGEAGRRDDHRHAAAGGQHAARRHRRRSLRGARGAVTAISNAASPPLAACPAGTGSPCGARRCRPSPRRAIG